MSVEIAEDNSYQAPTTKNNTRQVLLTLAQKMCRNMRSSYIRSVHEIDGVKYDVLCKKSPKGKYYAEVYHVHDVGTDEYTLCDVPCDAVLYQFDHGELKE